MDSFETTVVDSETIVDNNIRKSLISICEDLEERGYNPTKQIVAYLIVEIRDIYLVIKNVEIEYYNLKGKIY